MVVEYFTYIIIIIIIIIIMHIYLSVLIFPNELQKLFRTTMT